MINVQDWVIAACQWGFLLALLPSIFGADKPAFSTSLMTGTLASIMAVTMATLALWASAISIGLVALCWFVLALQRVRLSF